MAAWPSVFIVSGSEAKPSPQLMEIVEHGRAIHEQLLETSLGTPHTEGSCWYGSYLLSKMLGQFLPGCSAAIRGGDGCGDGGYRDAQGDWHGHYWVEVTTPDGCFVVDVTADQFGAAPIVVLPIEKAAAQYCPGDQAVVDAQVEEAVAELRQAGLSGAL